LEDVTASAMNFKQTAAETRCVNLGVVRVA